MDTRAGSGIGSPFIQPGADQAGQQISTVRRHGEAADAWCRTPAAARRRCAPSQPAIQRGHEVEVARQGAGQPVELGNIASRSAVSHHLRLLAKAQASQR